VIGVPDPTKGEVPKAFIIASTDVHLTEEELQAFCRTHLASRSSGRLAFEVHGTTVREALERLE
jgi:acyl-CoA synthetase (AMP-forming)/AMP-acid ligase II